MKKANGTTKAKNVTKAKNANKPEPQVCPFVKEVEALTRAHNKLFLAIAKDCKSRVRTMAFMYSIHASLTNLEFNECNKLFKHDQA